MEIFLIILATIVAYLFVGMLFRAAYLCYHAGPSGYVPWDKEMDADFIPICWPFLPVVILITGICKGAIKLSNGMFKLCFRAKHGQNPRGY